jgi:glucan 1,3-beta-glucosidase
MRLPAFLFAIVAVLIAGAWAWLGQPVPMPAAPAEAVARLHCVSYAPFRAGQSPGDPTLIIAPEQIDEDLAKLAKITGCVRTYAVDQGLDKVPELARKHGLKVLQGLWIGRDPVRNASEIEAGVRLANAHPDVIDALIVGNEVLLRGEMAAADLAAIMRQVKARVPVRVTYADVWEFWMRARVLADAADFITIHILPYWEDEPVAARDAGRHVDAIKRQVAAAFPGREILIGETGWPSHGRMRAAALPSPSNQARVITDILAVAHREGYRVNVIEAFDQPWKRMKEGTVGGHWGFLDAASRDFKFDWGKPVSDHPLWWAQAAGGICCAALTFAAALWGSRRRYLGGAMRPVDHLAVAVAALAGGLMAGWAATDLPVESLFVGDWLRNGGLLVCAILAPFAVAALIGAGQPLASFPDLFGATDGPREPLGWWAGAVLLATMVLTVIVALGLVFDPRYKSFPFAALTAAIVPFVVFALTGPRPFGHPSMAERAAGAVLIACAVFIVPNEGIENWQALWFAGLIALLGVTLLPARTEAAPG